jgi:fructose 1,6-bisphosphatase
MSTYPVDIKSYNITTATTHTVFDGPGRILAVSFAQPANVAVGTITLLDDSTTVAVIDTPDTSDSTNQAGVFGYLQFPGTGLYCKTKIKVTNALTTHLTVYYG